MQKITPTSTITLGDKVYAVAAMNDTIKQLVSLLDEARQRESDLTVDLLLQRAAMEGLQNALSAAIMREETKTSEGGDHAAE